MSERVNNTSIGIPLDGGDTAELNGNVDAAALKHIDELCDAMDREDILARIHTGGGKTYLDDYREILLKRVRDGLPLPERWDEGEQAKQIDERLNKYGTREWRKAHPRLVEEIRKRGVIKI